MTLDSYTKADRDLREIIALDLALPAQAISDARAIVDGHALPGGRALVAIAPVANLARWEQRIEQLEDDWVTEQMARRGLSRAQALAHPDRPDFTADEDDHAEPALQVLRFWTDHYRRVFDAQYDMVPTLATEAKFLRHHLSWIFDREPNWDRLRTDINTARTRLENVVHAGRRPDRSRVVCSNPTCPGAEGPEDRRPQLIRAYSSAWVKAWACHDCGHQVPEVLRCDTCHRTTQPRLNRQCGHVTRTRRRGAVAKEKVCEGRLELTVDLNACPNCASYAPPAPVLTSDPADDLWKCPACKTRYDDDAFGRAHALQLRHEQAAKFVSLRDAIATLVAQGRNERVVRRWLEPPLTPMDRCNRCRRRWPADEHNVCPRKILNGFGDVVDVCGGELHRIHVGDPNAVVESYCDIATHQTYAWWPDLWRLHLATPTRRGRAS